MEESKPIVIIFTENVEEGMAVVKHWAQYSDGKILRSKQNGFKFAGCEILVYEDDFLDRLYNEGLSFRISTWQEVEEYFERRPPDDVRDLLKKVWNVEYINPVGYTIYRTFGSEERAYKYKFEIHYTWFKHVLERDLIHERRCKEDPNYAKKCYEYECRVWENSISLMEQALKHIENVKNANMTFKEKMKELWAEKMQWGDDPDGLVDLGSVCCTNNMPEVIIRENYVEE